MKKFAKNMKRAFTITELVIVIAVIAILAAVLIPTFAGVISSAKESAAMQECRNALTVFTEQASETNHPTAGVVFVNNDYAYVNLGGNLHLLGKIEDLPNINVSGTATGDVSKKEEYNGLKGYDTATSYESGIWTQITDEKNTTQEAVKIELTQAAAGKAGELLYFYSVEVNGTTYIGYFTLEQVVTNQPASYIVSENSTLYSRLCGYIAITNDSTKLTVSNEDPAAGD